MSSFDSKLFDSNEKGRDKPKRRKKKSNKEKAEFQFDVHAAPIKLNVFFKDVLENTPDIPVLTDSSDNNKEEAQMLPLVPSYNIDCHEYSGEILEYSNSLLVELDEESKLEEVEKFPESVSKELTENSIKLKEVIKDVEENVFKEKMEYKQLTAKRLGLKALQMFAFSDQYSQHFHFPKRELVSYNVDMFVDKSESTLRFFHIWGYKYFEHFRTFFKCSHFEREFVYRIKGNNKARKSLGFSYFLSKLSMSDLLNPGETLSDPKIQSTIYENLTLNEILKYFGFKFFDDKPDLLFQLQHLNIITNYFPPKKKFFIKNLFDDNKVKIMEESPGSWNPDIMNIDLVNLDSQISV